VLFLGVLLASYYLKTNSHSNYSNPAINKQTSKEIALVYIGCSTCPSAQDENVSIYFKQLSDSIEQFSRENNYEYITIGVSSEQNINFGLNHLAEVDEFDEISIGNGLGNKVIQFYIWEHYENFVSAGIPQVLVSIREYETVVHNSITRIEPRLKSDSILVRKVGLSGIKELLDEKSISNYLFFE